MSNFFGYIDYNKQITSDTDNLLNKYLSSTKEFEKTESYLSNDRNFFYAYRDKEDGAKKCFLNKSRQEHDILLSKASLLNSSLPSFDILKEFHTTKSGKIERLIQKHQSNFSFVFYSSSNKAFYMCVDHFGQEQIYYHYSNNVLVFSSSLPLLLNLELIKVDFSPQLFLLNSTVRIDCAGEHTWFNNVKKVQAAHYVFLQPAKEPQSIRYWLPNCEDNSKIEIQDIKKVFLNALEKRSNRNIKTAAYLSGGVDSSSIVSVLHELHMDFLPCTFSHEGEEDTNNLDYEHAERFLNWKSLKGHNIRIPLEDYYNQVRDVTRILGRPIMVGFELAIYHTVKNLEKLNYRYIYSGAYADAMWGGQDGNYQHLLGLHTPTEYHSEYSLKNKYYPNIHEKWYEFLKKYFYFYFNIEPEKINELIWNHTFKPYRVLQTLDALKRARYQVMSAYSYNEVTQAFLEHFYIEDIPIFLDLNFVELSFKVPEFRKSFEGPTNCKPFLKSALETLLPDFIITREKTGFPCPQKESLYKRACLASLRETRLPFALNIKTSELEKMPYTQLLFLLSTQIWLDEFKISW